MNRFGEQVWIGADPGGTGNFGIALLWSDGRCLGELVDCADEAFEWLLPRLGTVPPVAAGIDAPLWWSSGKTGYRHADRRILAKYPNLRSGNVQAGNSLRGAALIQGLLFAHHLRRSYPAIRLTETHPKALLAGKGRDWEQTLLADIRVAMPFDGDHHLRDAAVSAIAAREGASGNWPEDLFSGLPLSEQNPSSTWLGEIHYYWPETLPPAVTDPR